MRLNAAFAVLCYTAFAATSSAAEEFGIEGSVQVNTVFQMQPEISHLENTVEAAFEASRDGLSFGLELASLANDPIDKTSLDLVLGYRLEDLRGGAEIALSYTRSYLDRSGWDGHKTSFEMSAPIADGLDASFGLEHDLTDRALEVTLGLDYASEGPWSFGLQLGKTKPDATHSGELSASYEINDQLAVELLYEHGDADPNLLTVSLIYGFGSGS
ncbi:hypothetical protein [Cognatishimia sp. F0-27]|uniref:hypothetical protein n=1 Tax=Cognatishimia sp. F0-27 TaxID=2816855 RepID=UPI001D0C81AB|nr:hypothetical protein [Cognatishimia sp. F0-27]MCC1493650.1 hypothetical protein [Cognatishimia sp. F0-27]